MFFNQMVHDTITSTTLALWLCAGQPKAIPWTHTTPIRSAANAFFHQDVRQDDTVVWPTNLGWMMGPWLVFAALLNGASIGLFQGSPLGRPFGEFVEAAGVSMLGLVPSIAKAWRASDCMKVFHSPSQGCSAVLYVLFGMPSPSCKQTEYVTSHERVSCVSAPLL